MMKKILALGLFVFIQHQLLATVRNVPSNYSNISSALNACQAGDTVMVQPGIYTAVTNWPATANIKLLSAGDSSNTILRANNLGSVLTFSSALIDTNTVIRGFMIKDGKNTIGSGINIQLGSPKFIDVAVMNNHINTASFARGAGVYCSQSNAIFENCSVWGNSIDTCSQGWGGGVYVQNASSITFRNTKVSSNHISGQQCNGCGIYCYNSGLNMRNSGVCNNYSGAGSASYYGGGIYFIGNTLTYLVNCLIALNIMGNSGTIQYCGGGIYCSGPSSPVNIINSTIADNRRINGGSINGSGITVSSNAIMNIKNSIVCDPNPGVEINVFLSNISIAYSDIRGGYSGIGNISYAPVFVSPSDFHLSPNSPCLGAGDIQGAPVNDMDFNVRPQPAMTNPDMGCYESNLLPTITHEDFDEISSMNVSPNPMGSSASVEFYISEIASTKIVLFDLIGNSILNIWNGETTKGKNSIPFDTHEIPAGVYFLNVYYEGKMKAFKLVKL